MKRHYIWLIYAVATLAAVSGIVATFIIVFQCKPVSYFWDKSIEGGKCISQEVTLGAFYAYSVIAAVCDITIGVLPIFLLKNLQTNKKTKTAIIGILSMACM